MGEDPISEVAKATQEVAKTARSGIETAQKVGGFLARVLGEPIENAVGILSDKLKYVRLERLLSLESYYNEAVIRRGIDVTHGSVPPKIALPVIEAAFLESDDELQILWANLLASAHLPNKVRSAFIDILKQLEVVDVHLLAYLASTVVKRIPWSLSSPISGREAQHELQISSEIFECAGDNLIRVRCVTPHFEDIKFRGESWFQDTVSRYFGCELISITALGWSFLDACDLHGTRGESRDSNANDD
jgi:abortive infection alpha-like protein